MEIKSTPWPRVAPWLVLLAVAFAAGRWHGQGNHERKVPSAPATDSGSGLRALDEFAGHAPALAKILAVHDSPLRAETRLAAFFEEITDDKVATIVADLHRTPAGPQRDWIFLHAIRRWGEFDPAAALAHANALENLPLRAEARAAVYQEWARQDAPAALALATSETRVEDRERALASVLAGSAITSAGAAFAHWQGTPAAFRDSPAGDRALTRIAEAVAGNNQRTSLQAVIASLPPGDERVRLTAALVRQWGRYEPEAAAAWLKTISPPGASQDAMMDEVFSGLVRRDPVRAALWATQQGDDRRRSNYVAAAVAEWAIYDSAGAETWVNEQADGAYLDGATSAIAAHFIEHRLWPEAFAWTRRILRNDARADLLGNLGRIWNTERPEEFSTFLAQTSLNRAEREMLRSKIVEVASP